MSAAMQSTTTDTLPLAEDWEVPLPPIQRPGNRVLHLVNGEHFSGAERVQVLLAKQLRKSGYPVDLVCLKPGRLPSQFDVDGSRLHLAPMRHRFDLGVVRAVSDLVREDGSYRLLHAHTPRAALIASLVSKRVELPWVYHVHSPAARDSSRRLRNWFNNAIERYSLRSCSHQVTVSNTLRNELIRQGWPEEKVTCVPNGVPALPMTQRRPASDGYFTLAMVALFRPRKGIEVLLDAMAKLKRNGRQIKLRCVGPFETPQYRAAIGKQINRLGLQDAVETIGFVSDVATQLQCVDALVLPSLYGEGMPMVVLEAMASGVPVIATRVEGTPEAIAHDREGLLAEPGDSRDLANQIERLASGQIDWDAMSNAALQRHRHDFSDLAMSQRLGLVYDRVLNTHAHAR
jgi:glycosyltransferase involved in cell wall biosynthesis